MRRTGAIEVLIAEKSPRVRRLLAELLGEAADIRVVGSADNGRDTVELTRALKPELVIIGLSLAAVSAEEAIEEIMAEAATPLLVTAPSLDSRATACLRLGALEVLETGVEGAPPEAEFRERLLEKVRLLSCIRVIRRPRRRGHAAGAVPRDAEPPCPKVLAIGSSTGGPKGVMTLLKSLPAGFPASVFVVQHLAEGFTSSFASWLDRECALPVKVAVDGARYAPGEVVVARGGSHLTLCDGRIRLTDSPPVNCCRPSIDVFFTSLLQEQGGRSVGVLLSGMGKDGAQGLLQLKELGATTIVQDRRSCAIFGMPRAAIELGAVCRVLPVEGIPQEICRIFGCR